MIGMLHVARPPLVFPGEPERVQPVPAERRGTPRPPTTTQPPRAAPPTAGRWADRPHMGGISARRPRRAVARRAKGATKRAEALIAAAATRAAPPAASRRAEDGGDAEHRQQHRQAVVVGAADDVDEDQRVEGDEGGGAQRVDAAPGGEAGDERGEAEDRERRDRLQHRDREPDRQPGERVGGEGEERAVGAGRFGPGDVGEGRVGRRRVGRVDVGVEAVDDAEPGVVEVAEDVVGEQDRGAARRRVTTSDDRAPDDARAEPRRRGEHAEVGERSRPRSGR